MKTLNKTNIAILALTILITMTGCSKSDSPDDSHKNEHSSESTSVETTVAQTENTDEGICDGYFAPTVVDEQFLEAYNLSAGTWLTEDGNLMLHIQQEEDDGLYYIEMNGYNREGHRMGISKYNMYDIYILDSSRYNIYECTEDELLIEFNCNDGVAQYSDEFVIQKDGEYIRFIDATSDHNEFILYPYSNNDISAESYIYINRNAQILEGYVPRYEQLPDSILMNLPIEVLENMDMESPILTPSEDVLREDAEIIARTTNHPGELSMSEPEFDGSYVTYTTCSNYYNQECLTITFTLDEYRITSITSESGELLYDGGL